MTAVAAIVWEKLGKPSGHGQCQAADPKPSNREVLLGVADESNGDTELP